MSRASAFEVVDCAGPGAPWLTLVHGASQHRGLFCAQVPAFRQHFRLLLVDLPGHGASRRVPGPFGLAEYADGVLGALDAAGVARTHLWGTHTGSAVGLLLATRHAARIASLVLEGALRPGAVPASVRECLQRARATLAAHGLPAARDEWFERSPWFEVIRRDPVRCRAAAQRAMLADFHGAPWADEREPAPAALDDAAIAGIAVPVLLVNGEHDVADFLDVARALAAVLPQARQLRMPGAGGFPLWEFPDAVNAQVMAFLSAPRSVHVHACAPAPTRACPPDQTTA